MASRIRCGDAAEQFIAARIEQGKVHSTIVWESGVVRRFARWYDEQEDRRRGIGALNRQHIRNYFRKELQTGAKGKPLTAATKNRYWSILKRFLTWLMAEELIPTSMPLLHARTMLEERAIDRRKFVRVDPTKLRDLHLSGRDRRDQAMLYTATRTARRSSDMRLGLRVGDVDIHKRLLLGTNVKKARELVQPLTRDQPAFYKSYLNWLRNEAPIGAPPDGAPLPPFEEWFLFPRRYGGPAPGRPDNWCWVYHPWQPAGRCEHVAKDALRPLVGDLHGDGSWHCIRRSVSRAIRLAGGDEQDDRGRSVAQFMLDHRSGNTTDRYTGSDAATRAARRWLEEYDIFAVSDSDTTALPDDEDDEDDDDDGNIAIGA